MFSPRCIWGRGNYDERGLGEKIAEAMRAEVWAGRARDAATAATIRSDTATRAKGDAAIPNRDAECSGPVKR
jgi:hypothetical protein